MITESVRWLQTKGYHEELKSILQKISVSNNVELPKKIFQNLSKSRRTESEKQVNCNDLEKFSKIICFLEITNYIIL